MKRNTAASPAIFDERPDRNAGRALVSRVRSSLIELQPASRHHPFHAFVRSYMCTDSYDQLQIL